MYDLGNGKNAEISKLTESMPKLNQTISLKESFPVADMLPKMTKYYRFNGSLTTPPCSEGVRWIVARSPQALTFEQAQQMQKVMGENNRPLQNQNARVVVASD